MKKSIISVACGCCGNNVDVEIQNSSYYSAFGLDGRPDNKNNFPEIYVCPKCGYASFDLKKKVSGNIDKILKSEEYRTIFSDCDTYQKRLELLNLLDDSEQKEYTIKLALYSCWDYEYNGYVENAEKKRIDATKLLGGYIQEKADYELLIMYVDSLRQLSEYDIAGELCREVLPVLMQDKDAWGKYASFFNYEGNLIEQKDNKPHITSEVTL